MEQTSAPGTCPFRLGRTADHDNLAEAREAARLGPTPTVELPGGVTARFVTRYGQARRILKSRNVSRDAYENWPGFADGTRRVDGVVRNWVGTHNALNSSGAEHDRLRQPLAAALTRRQVNGIERLIETITDSLLDDLAELTPGTMDLQQHYIRKLPLMVINTLLGIPEPLHEAFRHAVSGLFDTGATPERAMECMTTVVSLLDRLITQKRTRPGPDLISDLIQLNDAAGECTLSDTELRDECMLVISAGHETTVNSIGNLLVHLLTHPEQRELVANGHVTLERALEESLRHRSPIASVPLRFAVRDFEDPETGDRFAAGEAILIGFAAVGRDQAVHGPDADAFDVTRSTTQHLAFGHGVHFCPGAPLARMESLIAVRGLLERFPDCRLAVEEQELEFLPSFISNGYAALPVTLHPVE
ncbi:cytochrome P450 [Streptomyces sp. NPDC050204]|uniref:cytochrome P450 family protein n=1 Tax=Streptomyces sp. NPDC050204 TaxID=3155514 RepID=UPI00342741EF